ncbi:MAG: OsmC family protein [Chloroflexota bacterium]
MKLQHLCRLTIFPLLLSAILLSACVPLEQVQAPSEGPQLATATVSAQLSNQPGRAIVSARGNHFIVDSIPPLAGPNEELNPMDMMLGALGTCGLFVAERAAQELEIPLGSVLATVEGDLDPSGVAGSGTDPRIQAVRVHLDLGDANSEQMNQLVEHFTGRCPIYTTLSRSSDIEITVGDQAPTAAAEGLATARITAQLSNQPGRAIVSARGNHFVIDSVPPLQGPNEERNPLDLMLGSLATCGSFIFEHVAQEMDIPLANLTTIVEADFDPRGVAGQPVDPRIQALRVKIEAEGIDDAQATMMSEQFQLRCPIYTTLTRAAPIEITVVSS